MTQDHEGHKLKMRVNNQKHYKNKDVVWERIVRDSKIRGKAISLLIKNHKEEFIRLKEKCIIEQKEKIALKDKQTYNNPHID